MKQSRRDRMVTTSALAASACGRYRRDVSPTKIAPDQRSESNPQCGFALCGAASSCTNLHSRPFRYAKLAIDLMKREGKVKSFEISPRGLRKTAVPVGTYGPRTGSCLASLARIRRIALHTYHVDERWKFPSSGSLTTQVDPNPHTVAAWFKSIVYSDVKNVTKQLLPILGLREDATARRAATK